MFGEKTSWNCFTAEIHSLHFLLKDEVRSKKNY